MRKLARAGACPAAAAGARLNDARKWVDWQRGFLHLEGDAYLQRNPQYLRILEVLRQFHARTVLAGVFRWNYSPPVGPVDFTSNRCYVAWFSTEEICGHGEEARFRTELNNRFYAGQMAQPLPFLHANGIAAVLIAPEDKISDAILAQLLQALAPDYCYVDCQAGRKENAGVFVSTPPGHSS